MKLDSNSVMIGPYMKYHIFVGYEYYKWNTEWLKVHWHTPIQDGACDIINTTRGYTEGQDTLDNAEFKYLDQNSSK